MSTSSRPQANAPRRRERQNRSAVREPLLRLARAAEHGDGPREEREPSTTPDIAGGAHRPSGLLLAPPELADGLRDVHLKPPRSWEEGCPPAPEAQTPPRGVARFASNA